jgi:hypothetical protein
MSTLSLQMLRALFLGCRLHIAFGRIPVPSCVSIAIPPGLQTIAFHNPSLFKEEKCL